MTWETYKFLFFTGNIVWLIIGACGAFALRPIPCKLGALFAAFVGICGHSLGGLTVFHYLWITFFGGERNDNLATWLRPPEWKLGTTLLVLAIFATLIFWTLGHKSPNSRPPDTSHPK